MATIANHPQRNTLRMKLRQNLLLKDMRPEQWDALEPLLAVGEYRKGDRLARQGVLDFRLPRPIAEPTFYGRFGDWIVAIALALFTVAIAVVRTR